MHEELRKRYIAPETFQDKVGISISQAKMLAIVKIRHQIQTYFW